MLKYIFIYRFKLDLISFTFRYMAKKKYLWIPDEQIKYIYILQT